MAAETQKAVEQLQRQLVGRATPLADECPEDFDFGVCYGLTIALWLLGEHDEWPDSKDYYRRLEPRSLAQAWTRHHHGS